MRSGGGRDRRGRRGCRGDRGALRKIRVASGQSRFTRDIAADRRSAAAAAKASGRRSASPVARKLASELGVNLDKIEGTGPGGRITREDVERASKSSTKTQPPLPATVPSADRVAFRGVRKVIAERMHQSLHTSAQITITAEADVTPATEFRARHDPRIRFFIH